VSGRLLRPLGRLGLRARLVLAFAGVGVLVSLVLGVASALLVTRYVNDQSERATVAQVVDDAALLKTRVVELDENPRTVMDELQLPSGAAAILLFKGARYPSAGVAAVRLPDRLLRQVQGGHRVHQDVSLAGEERLVVGVPFGQRGRYAFFEVTSLRDLQTTLHTLRGILLAAAAATALIGVGVGRMVSRRLTRPLTEVTAAAGAIAQGDLTARLSPSREPDLAELARSFNWTAERLEARVRADARFAGDVSHQLRTPLTTMLNSLALLQNRRDHLPAELAEPLAMLEEDLMRFRKLVVDLLEISRADAGAAADTELVSVADLVRLAADARAGRPVTQVARGVDGLRMHADKRRLEQVLVNLVDNAETHGGGCRRVIVEARDHTVTISVEDGGPGVPAEHRERIFDRFARIGTSGPSGSGLGLAIVARHVGALGGEVRVEDVPSGGARFVVELPVGRAGRR
jgi:two-component system, OmpR family, sensor histidine kinase MtrB